MRRHYYAFIATPITGSGGSRIPQTEERQRQRGYVNLLFGIICRKLHESERNSTERGANSPAPLEPPLVLLMESSGYTGLHWPTAEEVSQVIFYDSSAENSAPKLCARLRFCGPF